MIKSMSIFEPHIYFIQHDKLILRVGSKKFPRPVLLSLINLKALLIWKNQGSFRLIPASVLCNLQTSGEVTEQIKKEYPRYEPLTSLDEITWDQGEPITLAVVKILLTACKKRYELRNPDTAADPTTESQPHQ